MRRLFVAALAALSLSAPALAPEKWEIDPAHTKAQFAVKHMMVSTVRGSFGKTSGTIEWDGKHPETLKVDATIDATTIDTGVQKRDDHLKSKDFFDVEHFPTITFKSTKTEKDGDLVKLTGDLTIHGVTRPVTLEVEGPATARGPDGKVHAGAQATTKIKRSDFGLKWNMAIEAGGVAVGDEVTITIDVEATQEARAAAKETKKEATKKEGEPQKK
ncbi:MAG TPA: YceI family protein [Planctomycetota bacterium]|nr:YceI family protein [Planctomycetota bacterium]